MANQKEGVVHYSRGKPTRVEERDVEKPHVHTLAGHQKSHLTGKIGKPSVAPATKAKANSE